MSSTNFHKNVAVGMQTWVWYNGGWVAKKPRTLRIHNNNQELTQKKTIPTDSQLFLKRLLKYHNEQTTISKESVILSKANIYISHDP